MSENVRLYSEAVLLDIRKVACPKLHVFINNIAFSSRVYVAAAVYYDKVILPVCTVQ